MIYVKNNDIAQGYSYFLMKQTFGFQKSTGQRPITVQYLLPYNFGCKQIEPEMESITHVSVCASKRNIQTVSLPLPLRVSSILRRNGGPERCTYHLKLIKNVLLDRGNQQNFPKSLINKHILKFSCTCVFLVCACAIATLKTVKFLSESTLKVIYIPFIIIKF